MSTSSERKRSGPRGGPSTCFLPNCAFIVQPVCPTCECKQWKSVSIDITASTLLKTDPKKVITKTTTFDQHHAATGELTEETPPKILNLSTGKEDDKPVDFEPNPSLFESDSGTTWLTCDSCASLFQVYVNATISVVAAGPNANPLPIPPSSTK